MSTTPKNNARMYDNRMLIQAGIDPHTKLPFRGIGPIGKETKANIKKQLRIVDEQTALHRYTWYNLPRGLSQDIIERVLFYRGQGAFFQINGKPYFLPYTGQGTPDVYGRWEEIVPLPFNGTQSGNEKDIKRPWVQGLTLNPAYDTIHPEDVAEMSLEEAQQTLDKACVLCYDYSPQISQTNISRQALNDPLLDIMSECIPFMRTALLNGTGIAGIRVGNADEAAAVEEMSEAINISALEGKKYVGVIGAIDFQELTSGTVAKAEEFMLAMQSLDNYRLSLYGLDNNGLFQKHQHMLEAEQEMAGGNTALVYEDGLRWRQQSCLIANSYFGWEMWCGPSESTLGADLNGDMVAGDDANPMGEPLSKDETSGGYQE